MSIPGSAEPLLLAQQDTGYKVERSLRFNSSDSAYLSRTPASAGNRKTWTWAGWVKRSKLGDNLALFGRQQSDDTNTLDIRFGTGDTLRLANWNTYLLETTQVFRDTSAWFHLVVVLDTTQATANNRARMYVNGAEITQFGTRSNPTQNADLAINNTTLHHLGATVGGGGGVTYPFSGYLADVHFIDGQALDPTSFTEVSATTGQLIPKAYTGSYGTNGFHLPFSDNSTAAALGTDTSGNGNTWTVNNISVTGLVDHTPAGLSYRDSSTASRTWDQSSASSSTSAAIGPDRIYWVDLGASKSFNRVTFSVVASGQSSDTSTNFITYFSTSSSSTGSTICGGGCTVTSASRPSATTPGTITVTFAGFASQTGRYIGITNGSGAQGGTYTYSNFKVYDDQGAANDSLVDTPTSAGTDTGLGGQVTGNYCTWNPLLALGATLSNGNLDCSTSGSGNATGGTVSVSSGKWYWEVTPTSSNASVVGILAAGIKEEVGSSATSYGYKSNATKVNSNSSTSYGSSFTSGDVIGVALDLDNGTLAFYKNGSSQGTAFSSLSGTFTPAFSRYTASETSCSANFGQRSWAYAAPSGFRPLVDTLLPAPVVAKPSEVMDVKLYTGNGSTQTISGLGFSPDWIWLKARNDNGTYTHVLTDSNRGSTKILHSNLTEAEGTSSNAIAYTSDGFTVLHGNSGGYNVNASGNTYVAWAFDAGSSTVTNTQGSITSQVRANASAGFSIVSWSVGTAVNNSTIGHGLGAAPSFIICKTRTASNQNWIVYHKVLGTGDYLALESTQGSDTRFSTIWGTSAPTSTVFGVGLSGYSNNTSSNDYIAYCFAPVAGYSSMGSFVGNGSNDGPFIYTGHSVRWLLLKNATTAADWYLFDSLRAADYNPRDKPLFPNGSYAEQGDSRPVDLLSNGFKIRFGTYNWFNGNGDTIIYCAFAQNPFQYARAR